MRLQSDVDLRLNTQILIWRPLLMRVLQCEEQTWPLILRPLCEKKLQINPLTDPGGRAEKESLLNENQPQLLGGEAGTFPAVSASTVDLCKVKQRNVVFVTGHRCDAPGERSSLPAGDGLSAFRWCHGVSATAAEGLSVPPRQPTTAGGVPEVPHPAVPESEKTKSVTVINLIQKTLL